MHCSSNDLPWTLRAEFVISLHVWCGPVSAAGTCTASQHTHEMSFEVLYGLYNVISHLRLHAWSECTCAGVLLLLVGGSQVLNDSERALAVAQSRLLGALRDQVELRGEVAALRREALRDKQRWEAEVRRVGSALDHQSWLYLLGQGCVCEHGTSNKTW
jgi:hypothetical protein